MWSGRLGAGADGLKGNICMAGSEAELCEGRVGGGEGGGRGGPGPPVAGCIGGQARSPG